MKHIWWKCAQQEGHSATSSRQRLWLKSSFFPERASGTSSSRGERRLKLGHVNSHLSQIFSERSIRKWLRDVEENVKVFLAAVRPPQKALSQQRDAGTTLINKKLFSTPSLSKNHLWTWVPLAKENPPPPPRITSHSCPTGENNHKDFFVKNVFCNTLSKASLTILMDVAELRNSEYGPKEKNQVYQLSKFQWPSGTELFHQYPGKCSAPQDGKCDSMEWTLI